MQDLTVLKVEAEMGLMELKIKVLSRLSSLLEALGRLHFPAFSKHHPCPLAHSLLYLLNQQLHHCDLFHCCIFSNSSCLILVRTLVITLATGSSG